MEKTRSCRQYLGSGRKGGVSLLVSSSFKLQTTVSMHETGTSRSPRSSSFGFWMTILLTAGSQVSTSLEELQQQRKHTKVYQDWLSVWLQQL